MDATPRRDIYRCVCTDWTFAELKTGAERTLEEIGETSGAGTHCGLCRAYIEAMLRTGRTSFGLEENPYALEADVTEPADATARTDAELR